MINSTPKNIPLQSAGTLTVSPVVGLPDQHKTDSKSLPKFALLLRKELEKHKASETEEDIHEHDGGRFFEDFMTLLYYQNSTAKKLAEYNSKYLNLLELQKVHREIETKNPGYCSNLAGYDCSDNLLYERYQDLYEHPLGTGFERFL